MEVDLARAQRCRREKHDGGRERGWADLERHEYLTGQ
jgi:hypothetical protein